jgi:hypothetical protein
LFENRDRRKRKRKCDDFAHTSAPVDKAAKKGNCVSLQGKPLYISSIIRAVVVRCFGSSAESSVFGVAAAPVGGVVGIPDLEEEIAIPPAQVEATTNSVLGTALLSGFKQYVFGAQTVKDWLGQTPGIGAVFFSFICDSAAANVKMLHRLRLGLQVYGLTSNTVVYFWWEPCALHQLARVTHMILTSTQLSAPLYALSRALTVRRNKTRLQTAVERVVADKLDWKPNELPPNAYRRLLKLVCGLVT